MRQTFWMSTMAALLALGGLAPAQAARFYDGKPMATASTVERGAKTMDEAQVRTALAHVPQIDDSIAYAPTGVAEFDAIEHGHGKLVGYFNIDGDLLPGKPADAPAFAYKKTFVEKDGHFLTVTYLLGKGWKGNRAPSYHIKWITWETQPQRFAASQDGLFIEYNVNCCVGSVYARGQYAQGKRTGQWHYEEPNTIRSFGAFVDDKAEGPWTYESGDETTTGMMQRGQRTGRWEVSPGVDEWREVDMHSFTGYDTFVKDRLNGPSERRIDGVVQWQGNYVNGKKQGQWVEPGGGGLYVDDVKQGP